MKKAKKTFKKFEDWHPANIRIKLGVIQIAPTKLCTIGRMYPVLYHKNGKNSLVGCGIRWMSFIMIGMKQRAISTIYSTYFTDNRLFRAVFQSIF
jgi:hypothetical protein